MPVVMGKGQSLHGYIARAEEVSGAMAHLELQLGITAEGGEVVGGKGVADLKMSEVDCISIYTRSYK